MSGKLALIVSLLALTPAFAAPAKPQPKTATARAIEKWTYRSSTDKMRGMTSRFAELDSKNSLRFGFPYHGGRATLALRDRPTDGLNVLLTIQGQFLCSSISSSSVSVKFDNDPVEEYECSEPDSGTTGLIFIEEPDKFVARLKSAKNLIIEATFFQEGPRQMEFDVAGLTWRQDTKETATPTFPTSGTSQPAVSTPQPTAPATPAKLSPIPSTQTQPPYPSISRRLGEHGTTTLRVQIDAAGNCVSATVAASSGSNRLDVAASDYVKAQYKWQPDPSLAQSNAITTVQIRWSLQDAE